MEWQWGSNNNKTVSQWRLCRNEFVNTNSYCVLHHPLMLHCWKTAVYIQANGDMIIKHSKKSQKKHYAAGRHLIIDFAFTYDNLAVARHQTNLYTVKLTFACSRRESITNLSTRDGFVGTGGKLQLLSLDTDLPGFCLANSASVYQNTHNTRQ